MALGALAKGLLKREARVMGADKVAARGKKMVSNRRKRVANRRASAQQIMGGGEEGEATTLESSDGQMTFSIRRDKTYQFHPWVEALIAAQKRSAIDLSAEKKKAILKGEAEELSCTKVVVFKGPKIK